MNTLNQVSSMGIVNLPYNKFSLAILDLLKSQNVIEHYEVKKYQIAVTNVPKFKFLPIKPVGVRNHFKELLVKSFKFDRLYHGKLVYTTSNKGVTIFDRINLEGGLPLFYVYEQI